MKMNEISKTLVFCLIIVSAIFKQSFFFGYYALFTDNFIETFCVNKDKPELQCDGKCFLSDLIDPKNAETPEIPSFVDQPVVLFYQTVEDYSQFPITYTENLFIYNNHYQFSFCKARLKPPIV